MSFFTSTFPRCLVFAFDWLQASISSYFTALLPIRRLSFLSHMQVPFFWITVFVNILQLSFSIYIFSNLNMVIRSSNSCFSLFIYRGTPPCDHPVYTTISCLNSPQLTSHSLSTQTWKSPVLLSVICHFLSVRFCTGLETETWWLVRNSWSELWTALLLFLLFRFEYLISGPKKL